MTIPQAAEELLRLETVLAVATQRKAALRSQLTDEVRKLYESTGAAPTLRLPGTATVSWAGADGYEVVVEDSKAWEAWACRNYPSEVTVVLRMPFDRWIDFKEGGPWTGLADGEVVAGLAYSYEVRPTLLEKVVADARVDDGRLFTSEGEIVPGLVAREKTGHLSMRYDQSAKAELKRLLAERVEQLGGFPALEAAGEEYPHG